MPSAKCGKDRSRQTLSMTEVWRRFGTDLSPPALGAGRQHLEFQPVGDLAGAQLLVEHVLADAVAPRQALVGGIAVERVEVVGEGSRSPASSRKKPSSISRAPMRRTMAAISCSGYSGWYCTPQATAPLPRISALWTSDTWLVASTVVPGRQRLDLVEMHGRRVEHVVLADVHRMLAAGLGQRDARGRSRSRGPWGSCARCRRRRRSAPAGPSNCRRSACRRRARRASARSAASPRGRRRRHAGPSR